MIMWRHFIIVKNRFYLPPSLSFNPPMNHHNHQMVVKEPFTLSFMSVHHFPFLSLVILLGVN